jgi:ribonuclease-3
MVQAQDLKNLVPMGLLSSALTHPSAGPVNNQRLEFLGDAVLELIVSEWLYTENPDFPEGRLSRARAWSVREETLAGVARSIGLGAFLKLGRGEEQSGGRTRNSILADALEAVIAALYQARGYQETREIVLAWLTEFLKQIRIDEYLSDYKTELQERLQETGQVNFCYRLSGEEGPDHDKTFWVEFVVESQVVSKGQGKSKKQAEQEAARLALGAIDFRFVP